MKNASNKMGHEKYLKHQFHKRPGTIKNPPIILEFYCIWMSLGNLEMFVQDFISSRHLDDPEPEENIKHFWI